jgi:hypothetical protein
LLVANLEVTPNEEVEQLVMVEQFAQANARPTTLGPNDGGGDRLFGLSHRREFSHARHQIPHDAKPALSN